MLPLMTVCPRTRVHCLSCVLTMRLFFSCSCGLSYSFPDVGDGRQQALHGSRGLPGPGVQREGGRLLVLDRAVGDVHEAEAVLGHERRGALPGSDDWGTKATRRPELADWLTRSLRVLLGR